MAVDLGKIKSEVRPSLPTDAEVLGAARLELPEEILRNKPLVAQFLMSQFSKLHELEHRPLIMSLTGEIPEMSEQEVQLPLSGEESGAAEHWTMGLQEADPEELLAELQGLEEELGVSNPRSSSSGGSPSNNLDDYVMDSFVTNEVTFEVEQSQEKWRLFIQEALRNRDPVAVLLAMGYAMNEKYRKSMAKQLSMLWTRERERQEVAKKFGIGTSELEAHEMVGFQTEMEGIFFDTQMLTHNIQQLEQKKDTFNNLSQSLLAEYHQTQRTIIDKYRAT